MKARSHDETRAESRHGAAAFKALDYIFVRGPLSSSPVTRSPGRLGSDHFPLLTMVRFRP